MSSIHVGARAPVKLVLFLTLVPLDITYVAKVLNYGLAGSHQQGFYLNILQKIKISVILFF